VRIILNGIKIIITVKDVRTAAFNHKILIYTPQMTMKMRVTNVVPMGRTFQTLKNALIQAHTKTS